VLKDKLRKFVFKEADIIIKGVPAQYKPLLNMSFGVLMRYIDNASEQELRDRIKEIIKKKEEIYQMLDKAKDGKLEVKDAKMKKVYPYLQKLLKDDNNIIKKVIDDFFREFENEIKDSENG